MKRNESLHPKKCIHQDGVPCSNKCSGSSPDDAGIETPSGAVSQVLDIDRDSAGDKWSLHSTGSHPAHRPLMVDVAGGGPVGLMFALLLKSQMGEGVRVRIYERRWCMENKRVVWQGTENGVNRRRQVVTLQSNVWSALPRNIQDVLFIEGNYSEMWPFGPDSPTAKGHPRNIRVRWIEDQLLDLAQKVGGIEFVTSAYVPPQNWREVDILAICDGQSSRTRESLAKHFGASSGDLFSINSEPLIETVLGLEVESDLIDQHSVVLTVAQNRFLFNCLEGRGFINMRLSPDEAAEAVGIGEHGYVNCIQRNPCQMRRGPGGFKCSTHEALFKPALDPQSFLWPRIQDGLRLFGVAPDNLLGVTVFRLGMEQTQRFTAQLAPGTFACLLGDAANPIHFWPGRGLNSGLKSALSLARCLHSHWHGKQLRWADFVKHEEKMHGLQFREKTRAWIAMSMPDADGNPRPMQERIRAGLKPPFDRAKLKLELWKRMRAIRDRLDGRMYQLPSDDWLWGRLDGLSGATLKVLVESGPWFTREGGGEEVAID